MVIKAHRHPLTINGMAACAGQQGRVFALLLQASAFTRSPCAVNTLPRLK